MFLNTPKVEKKSSVFEPIPKDTYRALITKAEGKDSQSGGRYLSLCFDVLVGPFKGRKVWQNLTTVNSNALAVQIGQSDMKTLAEALGHPEPFQTESEYLRFVKDKVVMIKVGLRKDKQSQEIQNTVNDYLPDGAKPGAAVSSDPRGDDEIPW